MDFSLIGVCLDRKSFRSGTDKAPSKIKEILPQLETYVSGVELDKEAFLEDFGCIEPKSYEEITDFLRDKLKKFPIFIGGDHSVTYPLVKAVKPKVFVSLDAHPDCEGKSLCFSSVTRKIAEDGIKTLIYGARCISKEEEDYIRKKENVKLATLDDLKKIKEPVYLSIDFDVLDPSIMPAVSVPEPEGLSFREVLDAVRALAKNLVAVDFVEFLPNENITYSILSGKLLYSTLAEIIRAKSGERR